MKKFKQISKILIAVSLITVSAFSLLKTGVLGKEKNALIVDPNVRYDIVADLDGGKFELGTKPEFTKMDNCKWLHKYKPTMLPTKIPKPVKDGYTFVGWTLEGETTPKPEYSIPSWNKKNINLKANWEATDSVLLPGKEFNAKLSSMSGFSNVREIRFEKGVPAADGVNVAESGAAIAHIDGDILTIKCVKEIYANPDCSNMFKSFGYRPNAVLDTIIFNNFNTSKVINMNSMFYDCRTLTKLDVSSFDTSNVNDMQYMFNVCEELPVLNVSNFNTSKVTDISGMFWNCNKLQSLDLSNFDTSKVIDMSSMFSGCYVLNGINLSSFNTTQVNDMSRMFNSCHALSSLDLRNFDTSKVTDMSSMFSGCESLTNLDLSNFNTSLVTTMSYMFEDCSALGTLKIDNFDTSKVEYTEYMFYRCRKLSASLKIMNPNIIHYRSMFAGCSTDLDAEFWLHYTSGHTRYRAQKMIGSPLNSRHIYIKELESQLLPGKEFNAKLNEVLDIESVDEIIFLKDEPNLDGVDLSKDQNGLVRGRMYGGNTLAIKCATEIFANEDCTGMFKGCSRINNIAMENLNTSRVNNMQDMFSGCSSLYSLDFGTFNTSKVVNMSNMFKDCSRISYLNINDWIASSVTNMSGMFSGCQGLSSLYLPNMMDNVVNVSSMFNNCTKLSGELTVTNTNITQVNNMFTGCATNSDAEFWVKYVSPETKSIARKMVNTKNPDDHVYLWEDSSVLLDGPTFNTKIKTLSGYDRIEFIKASPKPGIDVSAAQDGSISAYLENNVLKIACIGDIYTGSNASNMFKGLNTITNIKFTNFNSSNATNMSYMFSTCNSLLEIDLSKLNTSSVTTMYDMFAGCKSIKSFDLSEFDTRNVTSLHGMFYDCDGLTNLDLNSLNTSKVTDMGFIVAECSNLKSVYMNILNVSKVTSIRHLLKYCRNLEHAALPRFDFSKIKDTAQAFAECDKLSSSITINGGATTSYSEMFYTCSTVSPAKFVVRYTDGYRGKAQAMVDTKNRGSNVILVGPPSFMVDGNTFNSRVKGISGFANITSVRFEKGTVSSGVDLSAKTDGSIKGYISGNSLIIKSREDIFANINSSGMFKDFPVNSINFGNFNTDYVELMQSMFENCLQLTSVDVSGFNTSNVTNMKYMFKDCRMLANLDLSSFNTSNVEYMNTMFDDCNKLVNLNLDSFTTHSVIDMGNMFNRCSLLKSSITIKNPNITEYRTIFRGCSTASDAKFVVNYISPRTKEVAINMVATKSQNSNVILGEEIALRYSKIRKGSNRFNTEAVSTDKSVITPKPNKSTTPKPPTQNKTINIKLINGPTAMFQTQTIQVNSGKIGDLPKPDLNPKYAGQFGGYYYDKNCTIPVKPNDIVTQDIELYAKW